MEDEGAAQPGQARMETGEEREEVEEDDWGRRWGRRDGGERVSVDCKAWLETEQVAQGELEVSRLRSGAPPSLARSGQKRKVGAAEQTPRATKFRKTDAEKATLRSRGTAARAQAAETQEPGALGTVTGLRLQGGFVPAGAPQGSICMVRDDSIMNGPGSRPS